MTDEEDGSPDEEIGVDLDEAHGAQVIGAHFEGLDVGVRARRSNNILIQGGRFIGGRIGIQIGAEPDAVPDKKH